ncbi:MAG: 30S ribosome-binding factor RbfA [Treponema sp.]|nr:30S ribosome-binding factor RbfA [Treponema sp.]
MEHRLERLGTLIQEITGKLIVEGKIKDPRVHPFLSVTRVEVSKDLTWADAYVSTFRSESNLDKGVAGLQSAAGFIQTQLAREMHIRQTPKLRFHADVNLKDAFELIQKIDEIAAETAESKKA